MHKSLKNKILIHLSIAFIAIMLIVTLILSIVISRQNRKVAQSLFKNTFNIVRYTLGEKRKKLASDSQQLATQNDMAGMVNYVVTNHEYFKYEIMKPTYIKIAGSLYRTSVTADIDESKIYDMDRELVAFSTVGDKNSVIGYIHSHECLKTATIESEAELKHESWMSQQSLPATIELQYVGDIPNESQTVYEIVNGTLCMTVTMPLVAKGYNPATDQMEPEQVGILVTRQKLDRAFVARMSELSGMQINLFSSDGQLAGTCQDENVFDSSVSEKFGAGELYQKLHYLGDIKLSHDSFYRAAMPLFNGSEYVATVVFLHSKKDANAYTAHIIKMMSLVYFLGLLLMAPVVMLLMIRGVIKPIEKIAFAMRNITRTKDFSQKLNVDNQDEIGQLAEAFNQMTGDLSKTTTSVDNLNKEIAERKRKERQLKETQEELMEASRQAGMAEVATDVLHNVGNVLNSVNVSTTLINEILNKSEVPNLKKVADMIEAHRDDLEVFLTKDSKGCHVPSYLIKVATLLAGEQKELLEKASTLIEDVDHIKSIVKMQQGYAKGSSVEVTITLEQVIEDAIRINRSSLSRAHIQVQREYAEIGDVMIDKQRVIQILVNLIRNAKTSLVESGHLDKVLTVRTSVANGKWIRMEIIDNGSGIQKENLAKIFRHGFTTRKEGYGFGLHSGALAAKEMNGSLTVHSDGLGQGATFTLELPFKPAGVTVCMT